mmetsp:Transcript_16726/g.49187  ORF Transcript_16726/g.49187 Transcript_16726/m.49187 type:complete len:344 (+) Transcript_16726:52-1083(+)
MEEQVAVIKRLAAEAASHRDDGQPNKRMPGIMLSLRATVGPRPPEVLVRTAIDLGLLPPLLSCFQLPLELEPGGLGTARTLVALLGTFIPVVQLHPDAATQPLVSQLLSMCHRMCTPGTAERRAATEQITTIAGWQDAPFEFAEYALTIMSRATELVDTAAEEVMSSPSVIPLLMSDHERVVTATLLMLLKVRDCHKRVFLSAEPAIVNEIAEECFYILVEGDVTDVDAAVAFKLLRTLLASKPDVAENIFKQYSTDLQKELAARWADSDIADDLHAVIDLLTKQSDAENRKKKLAEFALAASCIAAAYRGYQHRRRLAALRRGVVAFQCAWRQKMAHTEAAR